MPRHLQPSAGGQTPDRRGEGIENPDPARIEQPLQRHRYRQDLPQPPGHPERAGLTAAALHALGGGNRAPRRHRAHHRSV